MCGRNSFCCIHFRSLFTLSEKSHPNLLLSKNRISIYYALLFLDIKHSANPTLPILPANPTILSHWAIKNFLNLLVQNSMFLLLRWQTSTNDSNVILCITHSEVHNGSALWVRHRFTIIQQKLFPFQYYRKLIQL